MMLVCVGGVGLWPFFLFGRFCVVFDVVEVLFGGFASFDFGLCWFDILRLCLAVSLFLHFSFVLGFGFRR